MKKTALGLLFLISLFFLGACSAASQQSKDNQVKVMTTFYPMYAFTKAVVGDSGQVDLLIPAGTEAHDYEPSAKDLAKISEAGMLVYNSNYFETWIKDVKKNAKDTQTTFVQASQGIQLLDSAQEHEDEADEEEHAHAKVDPHVWLDPVLAQEEVKTIRDALIKKYPKYKATFTKNASAYLAKLAELNQQYVDATKTATNKTFVTQHAAFGYLAHQYGLTQVAISGISPDEEPSPSRLASLKTFVDEHQVKVIYFEENASSKVAQTLAKETGVKLAVLNPLEGLTKKQMQAGEDYLSVMTENLQALKESIQ
ncbi:metal ABC transporter substrate-binding protein [Enterococcus columbae]|uniref:Zinc transport system substrate-binding protein n=1 Tax=Enterococcus columbae DSM 7374 = ATCC 51263 TaxID=1121865 RepID=S0KG07_9ENTE|nr:metal ABC transporter substrate-binding protein [Enterococcus columbae]EOT39093.1 zinc transport system substrate-binding protein [Enterococcus columbae DSM 7374 = ATCC 51263]EOW79974.1 zinc transport system substrate-binding protein [Enterococcus columbae DSM 7374 = ATCC 51263]OJG23997.1 zinc transport system substrate-binding protein [Enterococcus columbae DSM 7374 = ATCC 51263]